MTPELTASQKESGLARALVVRQAQAELKRALKSGEIDFGTAYFSPVGDGMKVYQLVRSLPGYGPKKATSVLKLSGIPLDRRVRGVGINQLSKLLRYLKIELPTTREAGLLR